MAPYVPGDHMSYGQMKVGYSVDEGAMESVNLDPRLPLLQHADLKDKVVLLRVDHNVVKKGTYLLLPHFVSFISLLISESVVFGMKQF